MITLSRLNGERILVNPDLIERAEQTPDTMLLFTNGTRFIVAESLDELAERVLQFRAAVLAATLALAAAAGADPTPAAVALAGLRTVRDGASGGAAAHQVTVVSPADLEAPS